MTRRYDDPVDVRIDVRRAGTTGAAGVTGAGVTGAESGAPAQFVWRGRLYTVLRVFEHWVDGREWWKHHDDEQAGEPGDQEFWRVEASPGRNHPAATYELRRDDASGTWLLARVWD